MNEPERKTPPEHDPRRATLLGLGVIALLVIGGLFLFYKLRAVSQLQDCAMQGRTNCAPVD